MDDTTFWTLIDDARRAAPDIFDRPAALRNVLMKRTPEDVQAFQEAYIAHIYRAYTWPLWGAAYVIRGGCSDDGFDYFRDWLVSEGRAVYDNALANPETLVDADGGEEFELEEFRYAADEAYKALTGRDMAPDYPAFPAEPSGEEWDEETVPSVFPKLAAKYW
ncbi:MAG: DUF4240 domain-containing protein [Pseudomonadota bacterium]